jgi:hypothetical protein
MRCCLSSSLRGFRVLIASTSIAFGSQEEVLPPCLRCPKRCCHWFLVPRFPWFPIDGQKERMAFLARYLRNSSHATCCHCGMVLGQTSQFMIVLCHAFFLLYDTIRLDHCLSFTIHDVAVEHDSQWRQSLTYVTHSDVSRLLI